MGAEAAREIIRRLMLVPNPSPKDVSLLKMEIAKEHRLSSVPRNSQIIGCLRPKEKEKLLKILRRKAVRTVSGVAVIAVMTKPWSCPQPVACAYCPGGPMQGVPQSYTGHEPAALRGLQNDFDPYDQVRKRMKQFAAIGHKVDKTELVIMGGTFPSTPIDYQQSFVQRSLDAICGYRSNSLEEAKRHAEVSCTRNVGITVETRPDFCKEFHVDRMLNMGITRVELGVQNIYDDIYATINRDHNVADVIYATRFLKDSGLKVVYHMMPGLPGADSERDFEGFRKIFSDQSFKPDMIKIYPCLVIKGTKLHKWWSEGTYKPYDTEEAVQLIAKVKKIVPKWIRIMRVQRDIPAYLIEAGVKHSNLRQLVLEKLKTEGDSCSCIRCREAGHRLLRDHVKAKTENLKSLVLRYKASEGEELFISIEDSINDVIVGYLRLRFPSGKAHRKEISEGNASIVRELKIVGTLVPVGKRNPEAYQHKGYGRLLLRKAEEISMQNDRSKIIVTSALGTKRYYASLGYEPDGPYMSKRLKNKILTRAR